jgi:hypothetical protein
VFKVQHFGFLRRVIVSILGISAISLGTVSLLRGGLFYSNWIGELVFAPLAILFGVLIIACDIFKPDWLAK